VGRGQELAELGDALDAARAGRGCLVLVSGPPGAGKTALAEELAVIAGERGVAVAWGR
jgi:predicted ATPase